MRGEGGVGDEGPRLRELDVREVVIRFFRGGPESELHKITISVIRHVQLNSLALFNWQTLIFSVGPFDSLDLLNQLLLLPYHRPVLPQHPSNHSDHT